MGKEYKDKTVKAMMKHWEQSRDASADNRTRALYIQEFSRPGAEQWDSKTITARDGRPNFSFNQLPKFGRQVTNDMRMNTPQIKFVPDGDSNNDKAEVLEDIVRNIQAQKGAKIAYTAALKSQVSIGWGYWRIITEYVSDDSFNQEIKIRAILNPFKVYDDPTCIEADRSDRRFLIEVDDIPLKEHNDEYDKKYTSADELQSIGDEFPEWATQGKDLIRIAEYWKVVNKKSYLWRNKESGKVISEKPEDEKEYDKREVFAPTVMWYKCNALEVLEEKEWPGKYIPYVYVPGETEYVNGKTYVTGLYEDAISTQKLYNYAMNTAIEMAESAPVSPMTGDYRAFKGLEKFWDNANKKNFAYLPYNGIDPETQQAIQQPQRMQNSADLTSAVNLVQMAEQNLYGTIGIYKAGLGDEGNEKSGKAILARQKEGDVSTFHYSDNFSTAQLHGGEILEDLIPVIYDWTGEVTAMSEDKKTRQVKINQKFEDKKTGKPMNFDLTKGRHKVMVTTGPSYTTKREESREAQIQLFQAAPQAMLPALPLMIRNMDWPNADKTAEAVERGLPPELRDPETMNEQMKSVPPAVQQQMMQAQQMIQQLGQQLEQATAAANDKQAENQAKLIDAQVKAKNAQTQEAKDIAEAQYKMMQLEFEKEKHANDTALEQQRINLEYVQIKMGKMSTEGEEKGTSMELGPNALQGHSLDLQIKAEADAIQNNVQRIDSLEAREAEFNLKVQEINNQQQNSQALFAMLGGISEGINALTASINAPKQVIRDASGVAVGVTTLTPTLNG